MPGARGWSGRIRPRTVATGVLSLVLGGVGTVGGITARAHATVTYVALGDSYTAGPGIPHQGADPPGCLRSDRNYPALVADAIGASLRDVSCGGATTTDMAAPQLIAGGTNIPQLDALDPDTDIVTVGIGGNDIGFSEILRACVALTPLGRPCRDRFAGSEGDEISRRIAAAGPLLAAVLADVGRRAPSARVYVVGYPAILPEQGLGCWPLMPFALGDLAYLRDKAKELNTMLAAQAAATGATYVDAYSPSVGHDACALPGLRWVEPVLPIEPAAPLHPNARGMRGVATAVVDAVEAMAR